jgi:hypothetical protein
MEKGVKMTRLYDWGESKTLKLNNEDESIDFNCGPNIEACMIEENATPLK